MRFKAVIYAIILCLSVSSALAAGSEPGLQKISEHVYAYVDVRNASPARNSFGANAGLVVGSDAALIVDTLVSAKEADRFLADIRKVTDIPVKYVVDTHYHLDHAWGACRFAKLGAVVIAQKRAVAHIPESKKSLQRPETFGLTQADLKGTTIQAPDITFEKSMTIDLGGVVVELSYLGPTHTDDSIVAYIPQDKTLFTGDALFTQYHPFLAEGDLANWQKALSTLERIPAEKIVPGHGPVSSKSDIQDMKVYLREFDKQARALCAGKTANDVPTITAELIKALPDQGRTEMPSLVEFNLRLRYLSPKASR